MPPIQRLEIHYFCKGSLSQPYCCLSTNTLKFSFKTGKTILAFIVPRNPLVGLEPKLVTSMNGEADSGHTSSLGYHGAIIHRGGPWLRMLSYSWPNDSFLGPSHSLSGNFAKLDGDTWRKRTCAFDEGSGWVVISCSLNKIVV